MKSFQFRLQSKLDLCVNQEQMAKEMLQARMKELDNLVAEQNLLKQKITELEDTIRIINSENGLSQQLLIHKEYLPILNKKNKIMLEKVRLAALKVEEARQYLIEKKKETNVLEKLRDKKWEAYINDVHTEEQKNNDEAALISYFRAHKNQH